MWCDATRTLTSTKAGKLPLQMQSSYYAVFNAPCVGRLDDEIAGEIYSSAENVVSSPSVFGWLLTARVIAVKPFQLQLKLWHDTISTRNYSSGDEIANVNFVYDDIVHALENTIDSCTNCATDRFLQRRFIKFSEITQCNGHYAVQGHSKSPILVPIESSHTTSY